MKSRVLLVEDDPRIINVLVAFLESAGHHVETAGDGAGGLRQACSGSFDLLITDVELPGLAAPAICQEARREGFRGKILILVGLTSISDGPLALSMGADDYLVKPFDPAEMVARVETLILARAP